MHLILSFLSKHNLLAVMLLTAPMVVSATDFRAPASRDQASDDPFAGVTTLTSQQLVDAVLARNPSLQSLRAAAEEAANRVEPAGALDDPQFAYTLAPETLTGFRTPGGENRGVNQKFEVSQAIPWPGTLALRTAQAQSEAEASTLDLADQRLQIIAAIKAGFGEWYYVHRGLKINRDNQALLIELRNVAETQYATGRASQQDVLQAEVANARLQDQALGLERERRSIQAQINALLNLAANKPLPPPAAPPPHGVLPSFENLQKTVLQSHPELMRLQAQLDASQAKVGLAEKDFYPNFKLQAGYNSLWDAEEKRFTVGVGINVPLDRRKYRSLRDSAQAGSMKAHWSLVDRRAQLLAELERSHAEVSESIEVIDLYQKRLIPLAMENLQAADADYRAGAGDFLNVTNAENDKLATELRLARAQANYIRRMGALERWSGGNLSTGGNHNE